MAGQREQGEGERLPHQEGGGHTSVTGLTESAEPGPEDPEGRHTEGVAHQLAAHRRPRNRVEAVQQEVGFARAKLIAVVLQVADPVAVAAAAERD